MKRFARRSALSSALLIGGLALFAAPPAQAQYAPQEPHPGERGYQAAPDRHPYPPRYYDAPYRPPPAYDHEPGRTFRGLGRTGDCYIDSLNGRVCSSR